MGLKYNKKYIISKANYISKRYLRFYRCHRPYMFDRAGKVFFYI